jgi:hypothetical protein
LKAMRRTLLACVLALPFLATTAQATQYIVGEARGIGLKAGSPLDPTKPLVLKQGQHLTLISEDDGQTIQLDGPYQKSPAPGQGFQLVSVVSGLVTARENTNGLGVRRGVGGVNLPNAWLLDATHSGTVCLQQGHDPVLWRPTTQGELTVIIMPADRSWKVQSDWPNGMDRLAVRSDLGMHGDATYFVSINGVENAMTISTVPATLTNDKARKAWMILKGCAPQADALLRTAQ